MKRLLAIVTLLAFFAAQQGLAVDMSEASLQNSSQDSTNNSSETSSRDSSQASSAESWQWSTDNSSDSQSSSEATTDSSRNSEPSAVALVVAGAVVSIAITVGGVLLTVHVSKAKQEAVLRLQDQIYLADGKDYQEILSFFQLADRDLIRANDELVTAGHQIVSDQDAADYLAALVLSLAKKSEKIQYQLKML
jgi:hypothetical protein